jgi:acetyl esterase/lipase
MTTYADAFPLTRPMMDWFIGHYMGPTTTRPTRACRRCGGDLQGLAPAVVAPPASIPLVDQGEAYARALQDGGRPVRLPLLRQPGARLHRLHRRGPRADVACREIAGLVREGLRRTDRLMRALVVEELLPDYAGCVVKDIPTPEPGPARCGSRSAPPR